MSRGFFLKKRYGLNVLVGIVVVYVIGINYFEL